MKSAEMNRLAVALVALAALALSACASTTFISSYRPPTAEPLDLKGEKVAAVVLVDNMGLRKAAENALARELDKRGAHGLPMYNILPNATKDDEAAVRAAFESLGIKGVVVMRPRRVKKETEIPPQKYYSAPMYLGYWGGYYPYGWDNTWSDPISSDRVTHGAQPVMPYADAVSVSPGYTQVEEVVRVEILIYSLKQNQLVWVGEAETKDPAKLEDFVTELADGTAEELRRLWLVPS